MIDAPKAVEQSERLRSLAMLLTEAETKSEAGFDQWCLDAADLITAQAQEIERWQGLHKSLLEVTDTARARAMAAEARMKEHVQEIEWQREHCQIANRDRELDADEINKLTKRAEVAEARVRELEEGILHARKSETIINDRLLKEVFRRRSSGSA